MYLNTEKLVSKKQNTIEGKIANWAVNKSWGTLVLLVVCSCVHWTDALPGTSVIRTAVPLCYTLPRCNRVIRGSSEVFVASFTAVVMDRMSHLPATLHIPHVRDAAVPAEFTRLQELSPFHGICFLWLLFSGVFLKRCCPPVPAPCEKGGTWIWGGIYLTELGVLERSHPVETNVCCRRITLT